MSRASAPGKIILFGEHAVVYGRPALAVPVTQVHVDVEVAESPHQQSTKLTLQGYESGLKRVMVAAGESDTRYVLNTILLDFKNNVLVATDGHRLHKLNYKFNADHEQVLLPIATAKLIRGDSIRAKDYRKYRHI